MITFVYGGSGSGKSEYAEQVVLDCSEAEDRYYIATMKAYGEEGRQRVQRHRALRNGKGFHTIECPENILHALEEISHPFGATVLVECISNLVANEMFDSGRHLAESAGTTEEEEDSCRMFTESIMDGVIRLCSKVQNAVIVSNNIFEDGADYDILTVRYLNRLGMVNRRIAAIADNVTEVVAGIPVKIR